jgi:hypothetical protein
MEAEQWIIIKLLILRKPDYRQVEKWAKPQEIVDLLGAVTV